MRKKGLKFRFDVEGWGDSTPVRARTTGQVRVCAGVVSVTVPPTPATESQIDTGRRGVIHRRWRHIDRCGGSVNHRRRCLIRRCGCLVDRCRCLINYRRRRLVNRSGSKGDGKAHAHANPGL